MTKEELLHALTPFDGELDLVIEHNGSYYEISSLMYSVVQSNGVGVVRIGSGDSADHLRFKTGVELL